MHHGTTDPADQPAAALAPAAPAQASSNAERRHDIDWLRTIALALLIVFHGSLLFLSRKALLRGALPGDLRSETSLDALLPLMTFLVVWRIPLLFLLSGMGVRLAMEKRSWKELLVDRIVRIGLPLVFGCFVINPFAAAILQQYLGGPAGYYPSLGHLWFLANIGSYVVVLLPLLFWLRGHPQNFLSRLLSTVLRFPLLLPMVALPLVLETLVVHPVYFVVYVQTAHGFWLGMICFLMGFMFASAGESFWLAARWMRWPLLVMALAFFLIRLATSPTFLEAPLRWLAALESVSWMLAFLGFASAYLNRPSRILSYLSKAVFPVYIIHVPVLLALSSLVLPAPLSTKLKWFLMLAGTLGGSLMLYELLIRRIRWLRPLFGMKLGETGRF